MTPEQVLEEQKKLAAVHPGLGLSTSTVLHRHATYGAYEPWMRLFFASSSVTAAQGARLFTEASPEPAPEPEPEPTPASPEAGDSFRSPSPFDVDPPKRGPEGLIQQLRRAAETRRVAGDRFSQQSGVFRLNLSERNTTPLFGVGLIDSVRVETLEKLEKDQLAQGRVTGRVSRLKDGKTGRFGWKGQTASLNDFVLTACAVELGLNVPGHEQAGVPHRLDYRAKGLDLDADECEALVGFVRDLPAPGQRPITEGADQELVGAGRKLFDSVGCADCHVADVDKAVGLYSDLLLHDLGTALGDSGSSYGVFRPESTPEPVPAPEVAQQPGKTPQEAKLPLGATALEWRTAPLWGLRDSAPYLHDGRADTIDQAVAFHDGEATKSTRKYFTLTAQERFQVVTFLKSLVAPEMAAR